ncbi:MAG TPA: hypothetical protein DEF51_32110 [Myxococcales bacterium]|nr:hypothetical protein [Myxococcales bacterium]
MTMNHRRSWKQDLYTTIERMGRDLEERGDKVRRWTARTLRESAPGITHAGAELAHQLRRIAQLIDARLFQEGKRTSAHA